MKLRLLVAPLMLTSAASPALAGPTAKVDDFAHHVLNLSVYKWAEFDLNGDGQPEQFLYANDPKWCGSGGCTLFILQTQGNSLHPISRTTVIQLPISVLTSVKNGWHDLAVGKGGGGKRYMIVGISYNRRRYANNPTLARFISEPADTLKVLIAQ